MVGQGEGEEPAPLPRVVVTRPRRGFHHPAGKPEILCLLGLIGERCIYGLRSIELVKGGAEVDGQLLFGSLVVPGGILLFDQPISPWLFTGALPASEEARFGGAGAIVERLEGFGTRVAWPGNTLQEFMLLDVLMHEIGHHMVQQYKGKRTMRVVRTRDHEEFAERFARRCRAIHCGGPLLAP